MIKINKGIKASVIYTISSLINKGINFITIPIFTRIMTTEQIGIVNTYSSWHSIFSVIACLSLTAGSFSVAMHQYKESRSEYQSSVLGLTIVSSAVLTIIYVLFFNQINKLLGLPWQLNVLMVAGFFLQPATDFWMARQRFEYKYKICALVSSVTAIVSSIFAVLTVLYLNKNGLTNLAIGRLYATYVVNYLVAIVIFVSVFKEGKVFYDKEYWKFGITLSLPLIIHTLSKQILDVSDRIMIQKMIGYSAVGIYGTLYSISSLSLIVWNSINMSLVPFTFSNLEEGSEGEKKLNSVAIPVVLIFGVAAILFAFLSPEIVKIIATDEYYEAVYMVPPVAAGIYFTALYNLMGNVLLYHKKTKYIMYATIIAAAVNVGLNYIFIQIYGYMAAAYTTLFSNIVLAVSQYLMAKKVHGNIPYNSKYLFIISLSVTLIVLSCNILYAYSLIRYLTIGIILITVFILREKIINLLRRMIKE
ncbi:oligosaccharide flippase family protein [Eubacterium sp.]|uniref:lipopolysaccharide biosynthesis protein n=1 Tax=Eubacterium sp. TaxID=142586 RepID=UPI00258B38E4|nr:oligosaccharide flippase family protein [Eubacterium sp.]MCR5368472.1 oligosaccharide flippase family protein [Eubacterium sp.]